MLNAIRGDFYQEYVLHNIQTLYYIEFGLSAECWLDDNHTENSDKAIEMKKLLIDRLEYIFFGEIYSLAQEALYHLHNNDNENGIDTIKRLIDEIRGNENEN
jgi:hypothetical protein